MTITPLNAVAIKLQSNIDAKIQILGDSTGQGLFDEQVSVLHGWAGRLGIKLGTLFDVNVRYLGAPYPGSTVWNGYSIDKMLHTTTRSGAATLTIVNGSMGGARVSNLNTFITNYSLIPDINVDAVITAIGFNDVPQLFFSAFLPRMQSLVATVRDSGVSAPIVITSQNRSTGLFSTSYYFGHFSSVANYYVGQPLNLVPAFQGGTANFPAVWYLDTMQAYPTATLSSLLDQADTLGGLHPNGTGYQAQADWMAGFFPSEIPLAPIIATSSLNPIVRSQLFSQTLATIMLSSAVSSWTVVSGSLPTGLTLNPTTGTISGTPIDFGGTYVFTVRASNANGFDDQMFSGVIEPGAMPFISDNTARFRSRNLGLYYPINNKMKISGSFRPVITKN